MSQLPNYAFVPKEESISFWQPIPSGGHITIKAGYWGRTEVMKLLVKNHLDINARGIANGYTLLHDAVSGNHYDTAKVLVEAGAKTDIQGHDGLPPLDIAKANGNKNMIALLTKTP